MKTVLGCAALLVALNASAFAEVRYDKKLEAAVMARVASKIGEIRGGFDYRKPVDFVIPHDPVITGSIEVVVPEPMQPAGSLTLAVDRKSARSIF